MNRTPNALATIPHIPSLDGVRAASALIVFLSHAGLSHFVPGLFGVTVFFFLSGFLITTLLRIERERTGRVHFGAFYLRRVLRIFPPLYLALGGSVLLVVTGMLTGTLRTGALLSQALFVTNYYEINHGTELIPGTEVFWSLAVEEHFYLLFPVAYVALGWCVRSRGRQAAWMLAMCAAILGWRCLLVFAFGALPGYSLDEFHPRICHATDARLDSLLLGCALAVYGNPALDPTRFSRRVWLGLGVPVGTATLVLTFAVRSPGFRDTLRYTLQGVALVPLFVAAIRYPEWGAFRLLNLRPVRFLGVLSYTFYLVHAVVIAVVEEHLPSAAVPTRGTVALVLTVLVSIVVYYAVERPCAALRKRFGDRSGRPRETSGARANSRETCRSDGPLAVAGAAIA
jgi:peptidoglycan/LPS O-acetylase OafA/YrhL